MASRIFNTGRVGPLYRGDWSSTEADYRYMDVVLHDSDLWIVIRDVGYVPAGTQVIDTDYWKLFLPGSDWSGLTGRVATVEGRATALETRATSLETRATSLETRTTALERVPTPTTPAITAGVTHVTNGCWYQKSSNGLVFVSLRFTSLTTTATPTTLFTLPTGYRPPTIIHGIWATSARTQDWGVNTNGTVVIHTSPVGVLAYPTGQVVFAAS